MEATIAHALPQSCFLPGMALFPLKVSFLPKLKEIMDDGQIIAASEGKQPELDRMRAITCRGCREIRCPLNFRFIPYDFKELAGLMDGGYMERIKKAEKLLLDLLPQEMRTKMSREGIKVLCGHIPSRKNPLVWFTFKRNNKTFRIDCEVGKRILRTDAGEQPLLSVGQVSQQIKEAATALS